jgi:integrase
MNKKAPKKARYGSGSLGLRGSIYWIQYREVKHLPNGETKYVRHRESTKSTDRDYAQRILNKKLQEIGGRRPRVVDPNEISYEDLRDAYAQECIDNKLRSVRRGKIHFTRLDKFFGGWRVKDFSVTSLKKFRQECRRTGLTDARTNRYMAGLRRMFRLAVENELLETVDIPSYFPMVKEPDKNPNAVFIKDEWYEPLKKTLSEPLRSAFILCYHTAMRVHEMMRLRWRDVDLAKRTVILPGGITKTGDPRTVFLPNDFKLKPGKPDGLVFPLGDTRPEWHGVCVRLGIGHWRCRKCGAEFKAKERPAECTHRQRDLSYVGPLLRHTRHTAVRNMIEAGMPRERAKDISGHITDSTFNRYDIGKEEDVEQARLATQLAHQKRQAALRK